jgi:hypothetical protein
MSKARKEGLPHKAFPQRLGSVNGRDTREPWVYGCRYEISNNKRRQDQHVVNSSSVDLAQADDIPDGPNSGRFSPEYLLAQRRLSLTTEKRKSDETRDTRLENDGALSMNIDVPS